MLPEVGTLSDGLGLWKRIFTDFTLPTTLQELLPFVDWTAHYYVKYDVLLCIICVGMLFLGSLLQRNKPVRAYFARVPILVRVPTLVGIFLLVMAWGVQATWGQGGFMYAIF